MKLHPIHRIAFGVTCLSLAGLLSAQTTLPGTSPAAEPESPLLLDPLVTTGTRTERTQSNAPIRTEVFSSEEIEVFGGVTIADSLRLMPSARFESDCQNCGLNQIQLLGLSTDYTAILFDGAPLYSGLAKVYGADLFPTIFVDHIEVVKGSSSVLYGPEAIAGVVNLVTAKPVHGSQRLQSSFGWMEDSARELELSARASAVSGDGRTALTAYGLHLDRDAVDLTTDGFTELPDFENNVVGLQLFRDVGEDSALRATYQYLDQSHRGGDQLDQPEERAEVAESLAHRIHTVALTWETKFSPELALRLNASHLDVQRDAFYGARGDAAATAYEEAGAPDPDFDSWAADPANQTAIDLVGSRFWSDTHNQVTYLDAQLNQSAGKHEWVYGVQYRDESLREARPNDPAIPTTRDSFSTWGAFVQDIWAISPEFELVTGARVDQHDNISGTIFSPRLAARYTGIYGLTLRASASTGFNAPGAYNEDQHIGVSSGGAITLSNSPDLREESSQTFSLGADWFVPGFDHQLALISAVHFTRLEDTFEIDDSGDPQWLRINGPDSQVFVWENGFNWLAAEHLRIDASISYMDARFDEPIDRVTGLSTRRFIERPRWTGIATFIYSLPNHWEAHAAINYTGSMIAVGEDADIFRAETPTFWEVDLGVSRIFHLGEGHHGPHLKLGVGVHNLFDDRQSDLFDNGADRDPTYFYGPVRPRTVYFNAGLAF